MLGCSSHKRQTAWLQKTQNIAFCLKKENITGFEKNELIEFLL